MEGYKCQDCGRNKKSKSYCFYCKKITKNNISFMVSEVLNIGEVIEIKHKRPGFKKFLSQNISGWFESKKYKKGVYLERNIDRENHKYHEVVTECGTNKIVHSCDEDLTRHHNDKKV